jgi:hypothetical protein
MFIFGLYAITLTSGGAEEGGWGWGVGGVGGGGGGWGGGKNTAPESTA